MNGLEAAIRNAIARAGSPDAEARARIYHSARMAVEKSLAKEAADETVRLEQRRRLETIITRIEDEYRAAAPIPAATVAPVWRDEPDHAGQAAQDIPSVADPQPHDRAAPVVAPDRVGSLPRTDRPSVPDVAPLEISPAGRNGHDSPLEARPDERLAAQHPHHAAPRADVGRLWFGRRRKGELTGKRTGPVTPVEKSRRRRGGGLLSLLVQLLIVAGLIGGVLWWIAAQGGLEEAGRRLADRGVGLMGSAPSGSGAPGQRVGAGQFEEDWAMLFEPSDIAPLQVGGAASAAVEDEGVVAFVSIASVAAGAEGEVRVPLDTQTLAAHGGQRVRMALTMRAENDPTQVYVRCALATVDDCGRRRFDVDQATDDLLFDIDVPTSVPGQGYLIINSDIAGEGRGIDLFSVRVQPVS